MWTRIFCFFAKRGQHLQPFNYIWRQTNIKQKDKTMKKLLLLFAAVLTLTSCHTKAKRSYGPEITSVRHARPFEKIQVKGACDVKFAQGDAFKIVYGRGHARGVGIVGIHDELVALCFHKLRAVGRA